MILCFETTSWQYLEGIHNLYSKWTKSDVSSKNCYIILSFETTSWQLMKAFYNLCHNSQNFMVPLKIIIMYLHYTEMNFKYHLN